MWKSIELGLVRLLLLIDSWVYGLVAKLFSLFVDLANYSSQFFSESVISGFTNRIYVFVGVLALFMITYSLLNSIVNPDDALKGKNSGPKIIMNLVISIILVALVPTIFNFAYKVQEVVLGNNIIGKLFLGSSNVDIASGETTYTDEKGNEYTIKVNADDNVIINNESEIVKQYGNQLAWSVLNAFFHSDTNGDGIEEDIQTDWSDKWGEYKTTSEGISTVTCILGGAAIIINAVIIPFTGGGATAALPYTASIAGAACGLTGLNTAVGTIGYNLTDNVLYWGEMKQEIINKGNFTLITAFAEKVSSSDVSYTLIISTAVGIFLLFMIFSYCLDLGLRAVKMAFYQMIAPIPIFARILPNNKIFNNWLKVTITTFTEVFIRMVILFVIVFLASNVTTSSIPGGTFSKMIIIMGIVTFGKQAPKLIGDLFGIDSGNMKLGIMDKLNAGTFGLAGGLIGGTVGAATGFLGAGIAAKAAGAGFFAGGVSGMANGWKARGNQFGKQKQSMYKNLGGKGKAGWNGKPSRFDKWKSDHIKDAPKTAVNKRVSAFESSNDYQNVYNGIAGAYFGMSGNEYAEAMSLGVSGIDAELQSYDYDGAVTNLNRENMYIDSIRSNFDYDKYARQMFIKSDYYDKTKSVSENKANLEKFMREQQAEIDQNYISSGGRGAVALEAALQKANTQKEIINRVDTLRREKAGLDEYTRKFASLSKDDRDELLKKFNAEARKVFTESNIDDAAIRQYKADTELQKKMGIASDEAKASSELAKQLQEFMKKNNIKPDDKK